MGEAVKIVSNSTPLIYLSKISRLDLLKKLFGTVIIPSEVYQEVVIKGQEEGYVDANIIENAIRSGWIKVKPVKKQKENLKEFREIHQGEIAVINLYFSEKADIVLMDEACVRQVARSFGLNVRGTVYVLLLARSKKLITTKQTKKLLEELIRVGFRLSPEIYSRIINEMD